MTVQQHDFSLICFERDTAASPLILDGKEVTHVCWCQTGPQGKLERLIVDERGLPMLNDVHTEVQRETLYGNVVVEYLE